MRSMPVALAVALSVQVLCQLFKLAFYSYREGSLNLRYLVTAGGVPSAHSAFVTAVTTFIGVRDGVVSDLFAVSFVFSAIVMYDAYRLRGEVQRHAVLLNKLSDRDRGDGKPLSEMVGHSLPEIAVGIAFGGALAAIAALMLPAVR